EKYLFAVRSRPGDRVAGRQLCATLCSAGAGQPSAAAQWFQSRQGLAQKQKRGCSVRRGRCPRRRSTGPGRSARGWRGSQAFADLFRDGMALVEQTAAYLDGPGRQDSKKLGRNAALAYATESMRLTTRLMQLASWLLLHRAVKEGEISLAQANKEKAKV